MGPAGRPLAMSSALASATVSKPEPLAPKSRTFSRLPLPSTANVYGVRLTRSTSAAAPAATPTHLMCYADIHGDRIVFTYEDDLWLVPEAGGDARRITSHPGTELAAKFNRDGTKLAFTGSYDGGNDVYVNGRPVNKAELTAGDRLLIGRFELTLHEGDPPQAQATGQLGADQVEQLSDASLACCPTRVQPVDLQRLAHAGADRAAWIERGVGVLEDHRRLRAQLAQAGAAEVELGTIEGYSLVPVDATINRCTLTLSVRPDVTLQVRGFTLIGSVAAAIDMQVNAGEAVTIPKEWTGTWETEGYTKIWVIYSDDEAFFE